MSRFISNSLKNSIIEIVIFSLAHANEIMNKTDDPEEYDFAEDTVNRCTALLKALANENENEDRVSVMILVHDVRLRVSLMKNKLDRIYSDISIIDNKLQEGYPIV